MPTLKEQIIELQFKINLIDRQLADIEKNYNKTDYRIEELHKRLDSIKQELSLTPNNDSLRKYISQIEEEIDKLKNDVRTQLEALKLEMPEMRLIKKIVLGLVAFILTAFLGLIWNSIVINPAKKSSENVEEIVKKLSEEYKKNNNAK